MDEEPIGFAGWLLVILVIISVGMFGGLIVDFSIHHRLADDSILINCIQIGEETLNGETATFYTCEGIR